MKAMIFSAGLGTRFKPWTDKHPKALALVNGKSLLQRNVEYLRQYGITDIIVNVHHFAEQVVDAIQMNDGWGSNITISDETGALLDTGGGLLKAKGLFTPGERFITCNADILTDLNIHKLVGFHVAHKPLISLAITNRVTARYLLFDKGERLCGWRNTSTGEEKVPLARPGLVEKAYSSIAVFEYEIFNLIGSGWFVKREPRNKFSLIDVYLALAAQHSIIGYDHSGDRWVDVGKPETQGLAEGLFQ